MYTADNKADGIQEKTSIAAACSDSLMVSGGLKEGNRQVVIRKMPHSREDVDSFDSDSTFAVFTSFAERLKDFFIDVREEEFVGKSAEHFDSSKTNFIVIRQE